MDSVKRPSLDPEGRTAVSGQAFNGSTHPGEGLYDAPHRPFLNGGIPGQCGFKRLAAQNAGDQADSRSAVSGVQNSFRLFQAVEPLSINIDLIVFLFYMDSQSAETVDG